jgi:hypothetical protein
MNLPEYLETRKDSLVEPIQLGRSGIWKEFCELSRMAVLKPVARDLQNRA